MSGYRIESPPRTIAVTAFETRNAVSRATAIPGVSPSICASFRAMIEREGGVAAASA